MIVINRLCNTCGCLSPMLDGHCPDHPKGATMDDIKVGDDVRLKSGGPRMTVTDIGPRLSRSILYNDEIRAGWVECKWFACDPDEPGMDQQAELRQDHFPRAALRRS